MSISGKYFFPCDEIRRIKASDKDLLCLLKKGDEPLVITESNLIPSETLQKWGNLDYMKEHMSDTNQYFILESKTKEFRFWQDAEERMSAHPTWQPPNKRITLSLKDFMESITSKDGKNGHFHYMQECYGENVVDEDMKRQYEAFNWPWLNNIKSECGWKEFEKNLLFIGQDGYLSPAHFDGIENFFAQIKGRKQCVLFPRSMFERMYPHPTSHPCDCQSSVDLSNPDFERFPKMRELKGVKCILEPGEVLYIPSYWFHEILHMADANEQDKCPANTVSFNFIFVGKDQADLSLLDNKSPLTKKQAILINRCLEQQGLPIPNDIAERVTCSNKQCSKH